MSETLRYVILTILLLLQAANGAGSKDNPDGRSLPSPTGKSAIGRRLLTLERSVSGRSKRTLAVGLWYPACKLITASAAPYFPSGLFEQALLREYFGGPETHIPVHAHDYVMPCSGSLPLLLFSPGLGVPVYSYSAEFEELASSGYVVAAVQHPLEGVTVHLPHGATVQAGTDGTMATIKQDDVDVLANDILFVASEIERRRRGLGLGKFSSLGVFGHSIGGVVALRSCQLSKRVKACLSHDGMYNRKPFFSLSRVGVQQPFLVLAESNPGLDDRTLASTHMTRAQFVAGEMNPEGAARQMYESGRHGSYLIIVATPDVDHMSFTDLPLLKSGSAASRTFSVITGITGSFFDAFVKGSGHTFAPETTDDVAVLRFHPAQ